MEEEEEFPAEIEEEDEEDLEAETEVEAEEPAETSLEEILAKKPEERPAAEEEEEESVLALGGDRDERLETLTVKVIPKQEHEFVCRNCHLVKHRSQLADKKRMYCRDCA